MSDVQFPPPREMKILSIVQVMFVHPASNHHMVCKIDVARLNKKLQKLQAEGMKIIGIFFTDLDKETVVYTVPKTLEEGRS
ncbi:hypothetical protein HOO68_06055 [Candidatus Gracilibacteria bacterium]|nr:hypothetical protein [Candidatus Gracilibacteria bacterium]